MGLTFGLKSVVCFHKLGGALSCVKTSKIWLECGATFAPLHNLFFHILYSDPMHPKSCYHPMWMLDFKVSLVLDHRVKAWDLWCLCQLIHRGQSGSNFFLIFFLKKTYKDWGPIHSNLTQPDKIKVFNSTSEVKLPKNNQIQVIT